ncbi:hypothetical protein BH09BAC2_BH09BAC2_07630 [soil metagenome]
MKTLALFLALTFTFCRAGAQDPHFSQFFSSPLTLNPAFTGKFDGAFRVAGNYKNQWPAFDRAYVTSTVSLDFPFLQSKLPEFDTWGVGILALTDKAANGILAENYIGVSTAYHKALNEDGFQQISAGFQAIYGQKKLDISRLIFEDQFSTFGFDLTKPSGDIPGITAPDFKYLDVNAGILYTNSVTDRDNFYVGVSMYHLNKPKQSFKQGTWNIGTRTTVTAGGFFPVSTLLTLHTSAIYQLQNKASEFTFGGALAASLEPDESDQVTSVYAGAWMRWKDALVPYVGIEFNGLRIGTSYDINTSSLKSGSQSRGGFELSLIYIKPAAESRGIPCPKF